MKSRAPQLHLEYRFYKTLGSAGKDNTHVKTPALPCVSLLFILNILIYSYLSVVIKFLILSVFAQCRVLFWYVSPVYSYCAQDMNCIHWLRALWLGFTVILLALKPTLAEQVFVGCFLCIGLRIISHLKYLTCWVIALVFTVHLAVLYSPKLCMKITEGPKWMLCLLSQICHLSP